MKVGPKSSFRPFLHRALHLKENSLWKLFCNQNSLRKCNRFSTVIVNMQMTHVTDGCGMKCCIKLDKLFVLIYFSLLHKIGNCSTLYFCYAN